MNHIASDASTPIASVEAQASREAGSPVIRSRKKLCNTTNRKKLAATLAPVGRVVDRRRKAMRNEMTSAGTPARNWVAGDERVPDGEDMADFPIEGKTIAFVPGRSYAAASAEASQTAAGLTEWRLGVVQALVARACKGCAGTLSERRSPLRRSAAAGSLA